MQQEHTPVATPAVAHVFPVAAAYVKPVDQDGKRMYAIHDQHGTVVAMAATRELAFAFLGQQDIQGVDAH